jgi:MoaA/NifB/PqqE/SkfB family radical SAM enzyme
MKCQYCIKHYEYKIEDNNLFIRKSKNENFYFFANISHLFLRAYKVLCKLNEQYDVGLLTFSGSEIFLFDEIFDLISKVDKMFNKVQLITNGLNLNIDKIEKLKILQNTHLTISLDGNTIQSNYARTISNDAKLNRILENLDRIVESGIAFDIYTVITKYNIDMLQTYFEFLEKKKSDISVQLWPVFGSNSLKPYENQFISFENLINRYDNFKLKLQPKKYYKALLSYLKSGYRQIPCFLPRYSFYLKDDGNIEACLCNGVTGIGNILVDSSLNIEEKKENNSFYENLDVNNISKVLPCSKCFINWDIINLYLIDEISIQDIERLPLLNDKNIIKMLLEFKAELVT